MEDVLRKLLEEQEGWYYMLDSVLFAIRTTCHSLTGMSPYRMVYNKDPLLPFEFADKQKAHSNGFDSDNEELGGYSSSSSSSNSKHGTTDNDVCETKSSTGIQELMETVQKLENQRKEVFENAHVNMKKAQAQQTRSYNNRNCSGVPFEIRMHVLKCNQHCQNKWGKLWKPFNGPYTIIAKCSTGFYLHDRYSQVLSKAVVPSQLVRFFDKGRSESKSIPTSQEASGSKSDISDVENNGQSESKSIPTSQEASGSKSDISDVENISSCT